VDIRYCLVLNFLANWVAANTNPYEQLFRIGHMVTLSVFPDKTCPNPAY